MTDIYHTRLFRKSQLLMKTQTWIYMYMKRDNVSCISTELTDYPWEKMDGPVILFLGYSNEFFYTKGPLGLQAILKIIHVYFCPFSWI